MAQVEATFLVCHCALPDEVIFGTLQLGPATRSGLRETLENHRKTIRKWWFHEISRDLPSGNDCYIAIENGPVEILSFPIHSMVIAEGSYREAYKPVPQPADY